MAQPDLVGRNFDLGFQSDYSRDQLPRGAAYRMRDWIPQLEAPLRKRGGFIFVTSDLNALSSATYMSGVGWAPFEGDPHLISISETGKVYRNTAFTGLTGAFIGTTHGQRMTHRPFWHKDRMILPAQMDAAAANVYKYYDSGGLVYTTAVLGGTPPQAAGGFSYGDYLALFNGYVGGTLYPYRMWFSGVGNPESWVTSGASASYWDFPEEVIAALPLRNVIIVWGYSNTWMLTGDTPPPGGNFARRTLFSGNGTFDGRSVATWREYAIWANNSGVYRTDGATLTDLTKVGGISNYWRALVSAFSFQQGWSAAAGIIRGEYVITIRNAAGALVTTLHCDLDRQTWHESTNINATMYAERSSGPGTATVDGHEELFFSHAAYPRSGALSTLWTPSATYALDGDGTAVLPVLETPFYKLGSEGLKRLRRAYVTYDIRTAGASPYLQAAAIFSPEDAAYENLSPTLVTTTEQQREPVEVRERALGIGLRLTQVGASADTRLAEIELEGHVLEGSR